VRLSIFSQQTGIQFITLFSLVIAIILFGILGILEAKELSALLGGISGYILGRATSDRATAGAIGGSHSVTGTTIAFTSPNIISDAANKFGIFRAGDRIQITGSTRNNSTLTVATVSAGTIQTIENTIQTEAAGAAITITV
jgi:hypothetical protein